MSGATLVNERTDRELVALVKYALEDLRTISDIFDMHATVSTAEKALKELVFRLEQRKPRAP